VFEEFNGARVTPSMYEFMALYVMKNISNGQLYEVQGGDYLPGEFEQMAVDAYWSMSDSDRIDLHNTTMVYLEAEILRAEEKMYACIDIVLDDGPGLLEPSNPMYTDLYKWFREQKIKWEKIAEDLKNELIEEESWENNIDRV